ncbi:hypothetical protein HZH68_015263 [Vespula germanica]|uniref:Uncharacterized protein n=1 Tax=Vespula germanica TaxID=30212 RepID=A0A834J5T0_VESGE|nr:hypothetical protein HZH68_015263 [Vespula germanica]
MGKARLAGFTADTTLVACFQVKLEETFGLRIRPYMYLCDIPWNTKNKHHFVPVPHDFSSGNVPTTWDQERFARGRTLLPSFFSSSNDDGDDDNGDDDDDEDETRELCE